MLLKHPLIIFSGDRRIIHPYYVAKPCIPFRHKNFENAVSSSCLWISSLNLVLSTPFACIGQNIFLGTFISKELLILTIFQGTDYTDDFARKCLCFTNIYDNAMDHTLYIIILSVCLSVRPSVRPPAHPPTHPPVCLSVCLSVRFF